MKLLVLMNIAFFFLSCSSNKEELNKTKSTSNSESLLVGNPKLSNEELAKLKELIFRNCDSLAYNKLSSYFLLNGGQEELLYYALLMANRKSNANACHDIFYILSFSRINAKFNDYDTSTKNMAIYYLLKAYELGDESAIYDIHNLFPDSKIPNSSEYNCRDKFIPTGSGLP